MDPAQEVVIAEEGYVYVYLSNENPDQVNVYFDDVIVEYAPTNVIQYNEYYPFGLQTGRSWTREEATENNYLYNQGNELNKSTNWYEMHYRGYDPALGRMLQVDPYTSSFSSLTPFNYAGNSPLMMNDPSGGYMDNFMDRATVGLGDDYLGGSNLHSRPSLEYYKDWTASLRSTEMNFALMGWSAFEDFYGVDLSSKEGKEWFVDEMGISLVKNGQIARGAESFFYKVETPFGVTYGINMDDVLEASHNRSREKILSAAEFHWEVDFDGWGSKGEIELLANSSYNNTGTGDIPAAISLGFEGAAVKGNVENYFGSKRLNLLVGGRGSIASAQANLDLGFFSGEGGRRGILVDANAGAYAAEGQVNFGFTAGGWRLLGTIGGSYASAHAGGTIGFYVENGYFNIVGFEHLGLGVGERFGFRLQIPMPKW